MTKTKGGQHSVTKSKRDNEKAGAARHKPKEAGTARQKNKGDNEEAGTARQTKGGRHGMAKN